MLNQHVVTQHASSLSSYQWFRGSLPPTASSWLGWARSPYSLGVIQGGDLPRVSDPGLPGSEWSRGGYIYIGVNRAGMHKTRCIVHPGISVPYVLTPVTFVTYMLHTRNKRHCALPLKWLFLFAVRVSRSYALPAQIELFTRAVTSRT